MPSDDQTHVNSMFENRPRIYNLLHAARLVAARSQTQREERACLCRHLAGKSVGVEIGTFMGLTAAELARAMDSGAQLYCIDSYPGAGEPLMSIAQRTIRRSGAADRVKLLRTTSLEAMPHLPSGIDFVFVDGDHSTAGLQADWKFVQQVLKPGGIAAFHDVNTSPGLPDSPEAAHFFAVQVLPHPDFELVEYVMSLAVMRRLR
jgi:predicted O-methyltransferase YrrM